MRQVFFRQIVFAVFLIFSLKMYGQDCYYGRCSYGSQCIKGLCLTIREVKNQRSFHLECYNKQREIIIEKNKKDEKYNIKKYSQINFSSVKGKMIRDIENHSKELNETGVKFSNSNFLYEFKQVLNGFEYYEVKSIERDNVMLVSNYVSNDGGKYTLHYSPNSDYWKIDYKKYGSLNIQKKSYYDLFGWTLLKKDNNPFILMKMYVNATFGGTEKYRNWSVDFNYDKSRRYSTLVASIEDLPLKSIIIDPVQQILKKQDSSRSNYGEVVMNKNGFSNSKVVLNSFSSTKLHYKYFSRFGGWDRTLRCGRENSLFQLHDNHLSTNQLDFTELRKLPSQCIHSKPMTIRVRPDSSTIRSLNDYLPYLEEFYYRSSLFIKDYFDDETSGYSKIISEYNSMRLKKSLISDSNKEINKKKFIELLIKNGVDELQANDPMWRSMYGVKSVMLETGRKISKNEYLKYEESRYAELGINSIKNGKLFGVSIKSDVSKISNIPRLIELLKSKGLNEYNYMDPKQRANYGKIAVDMLEGKSITTDEYIKNESKYSLVLIEAINKNRITFNTKKNTRLNVGNESKITPIVVELGPNTMLLKNTLIKKGLDKNNAEKEDIRRSFGRQILSLYYINQRISDYRANEEKKYSKMVVDYLNNNSIEIIDGLLHVDGRPTYSPRTNESIECVSNNGLPLKGENIKKLILLLMTIGLKEDYANKILFRHMVSTNAYKHYHGRYLTRYEYCMNEDEFSLITIDFIKDGNVSINSKGWPEFKSKENDISPTIQRLIDLLKSKGVNEIIYRDPKQRAYMGKSAIFNLNRKIITIEEYSKNESKYAPLFIEAINKNLVKF